VSDRKRYEDALRQREATLRDSQAELRTLTTRLINAQDQERKRISRDLHDDINQRLALLAIDLEMLEKELPASSGKLQKKLEMIRTSVTDLSGDLRGLAYQLHSTVQDDLGLPIALQRYAADYSRRTGIKCLVALMDVPKTLPKGVGSALFKITQECLGNVLKHAKAKEVLITLAGGDRSLRLSVRDDGVGFVPDSPDVRTKGMGFISMRERVLMLGGEFLIESQSGQGAVVIVMVPLS
jgi:signal transduction histidine kinase